DTGSGFLQQVALGPLLSRIAVDEVGAEERAAGLAKRSIKKASKVAALRLAVAVMDLTTLEGSDTVGKVQALCAKARQPDPADPSVPPVAAVCVSRAMAPPARQALGSSGVKVASVATAFPSGQASLAVRLADVAEAVEAGADEIDMVINRGAFLAGRLQEVFEEIVVVKEACGQARLKVILETGELGTLDNVRRASVLAMAAGADFIKTSTGKIQPAATLPVALVMLEAIRDYHDRTGRMVGMKPAGGVRTAKQAIQHLVVVNKAPGPDWLTPEWFRLGASSLLNDCLMQLAKERSGRYQSGDYFTKDKAMPDQWEGGGAAAHPAFGLDYAPAPEATDHVQLRADHGLLIGGRGVEPGPQKRFKTTNPATEGAGGRGGGGGDPAAQKPSKPHTPATGGVWAEGAEAGEEDVDAAVRAARSAY